jgi:hypothetical protein
MNLWIVFPLLCMLHHLKYHGSTLLCNIRGCCSSVDEDSSLLGCFTPCWLVNTDIFEVLAATTFRVYPRTLESLSTLWFVRGNSIGQILKMSLNCNVHCGVQISCDTSKEVSYMLQSLHTINLQGQDRNGNMCCLRTVKIFCLLLQVI